MKIPPNILIKWFSPIKYIINTKQSNVIEDNNFFFSNPSQPLNFYTPKPVKEKKKEEKDEKFELDTEMVINMTNKNKVEKEEAQRKKITKQEKKRRKRIKKIKFFLKIFLLVGIIAGSITFALTSPIFNIKDIKVINNNKIPTDTVISLSGLKTDENIFKFYKKSIIQKIKENVL